MFSTVEKWKGLKELLGVKMFNDVEMQQAQKRIKRQEALEVFLIVGILACIAIQTACAWFICSMILESKSQETRLIALQNTIEKLAYLEDIDE